MSLDITTWVAHWFFNVINMDPASDICISSRPYLGEWYQQTNLEIFESSFGSSFSFIHHIKIT